MHELEIVSSTEELKEKETKRRVRCGSILSRGGNPRLRCCFVHFFIKVPMVVLAYALCMCLLYFSYGVGVERMLIYRDADRIVDKFSRSVLLFSSPEYTSFLREGLDRARSVEFGGTQRNEGRIYNEVITIVYALALVCPLLSLGSVFALRIISSEPQRQSLAHVFMQLLVLCVAILSSEFMFIKFVVSESVLIDENTVLHEMATALKQRL